MERKPILPDFNQIPQEFHSLIQNASVFDSSCSPQAKVLFIDKDKGYFLKSSAKGTLDVEAQMARFFHKKGLTGQVLSYISDEYDWLLTERVVGEDCTNALYMENPEKLCDTTAQLLRQLHETDFSGCPVMNRTEKYLSTAKHNYRNGIYDASLFPDNWGYKSADEAWRVIKNNAHLLNSDTLLHGDYCLPNVILDNWRFSGFIDLGAGGVGDRHVDLFWGVWTLFFNLKTDKYTRRFLDAYGRECVEEEMLRLVAAVEVFG